MATWWVWIGRHRVMSLVLGAVVALVVIAAVPESPVEPERPVVYVDEEGDVLSSTGDGDAGVEFEDGGAPGASDAAEQPLLEPPPPARARPRAERRRAQRSPATYLVVDVVDGDTIRLGNGATVRLAGIDSPEQGKCGFDGAADALARMVEGKRVVLARTDEDRDGGGRLLRYVDVAGVDAGLRLIRRGLAIARYDSRDGYGRHPREDRYVAADRGSRAVCTEARGLADTRPKADPGAKSDPRSDPLD